MKIRDVIRFLQLLRAGQIDVSADEEWVRCSCPIAPFTHASGHDDNPSFGIKVNPKGLSSYNCFSCGSGTILDLLHRINFTIGMPDQARRFFAEKEILDELPDHSTEYFDKYSIAKEPERSENPIPIPVEILDYFPLLVHADGYEADRCRDWLKGRGIEEPWWAQLQTRYNPKARVIVFPVIDTDGKTYHLHARSRIDKSFFYYTPKMFGVKEKWGRKDYWYGIQYYDRSLPVYLVESETDLLRLRSIGVYNVLASCGPLNRAKLQRVKSKMVFLGFDDDKPGKEYRRKAISLIEDALFFTVLEWGVAGINDAGDLQDKGQFNEVFAARNVITKGGVLIHRSVRYHDKFAQSDDLNQRG